jgi:hypothetical protein
MGEVYRARDTKLKRDVAIKLLPENLAGGRGRLARLQSRSRCEGSWNRSAPTGSDPYLTRMPSPPLARSRVLRRAP